MLWKCSVCGFIHKGNDAPEKCPKCLSLKKSMLFYLKRMQFHMEIIKLAIKINALAKEGIEINLDPPCVALFKQANDEALIIKQRSKAEIAGHVGRGKW